MKHGKNPTLKQKKLMVENKYKWENWLVLKETAEGMKILNKFSGIQRKIIKG